MQKGLITLIIRQMSSSSSSATSQRRANAKKIQAGVSIQTKPVNWQGQQYEEVSEGKAKVLFVDKNQVFYNPVQETNRDLSVLMIREYTKRKLSEWQEKLNRDRDVPFSEAKKREILQERIPIKILEALSATGLRSIRYWKELDNVKRIVANDIDPSAVKAIDRNILYNGGNIESTTVSSSASTSTASTSTATISSNQSNAVTLLSQSQEISDQFDVIDIDPYGSAAPFLDGSVGAVENGGLLLVTCTDAPVLCGKYPGVCFSKYDALSLEGKYCHEMGLRILLGALERHAGRYQRYIVPYLSLSIDFYMRVFVRVFDSPLMAKRSIERFSNVYQCIRCRTPYFQPIGRVEQYESKKGHPAWKFKNNIHSERDVPNQCTECDSHLRIGGPIWNGPLHDPDVCASLLKELDAKPNEFGAYERVKSMLLNAQAELSEPPLFYNLAQMASYTRAIQPKKVAIHSAVLNAGYRVSMTHIDPDGMKTDAPHTFVWDIFRHLVTEQRKAREAEGTTVKSLSANSTSAKILSKPVSHEIDFTLHPKAVALSEGKHPRYPMNPTSFWGPRRRATGANDNNQAKRKQEKQSSSISKKQKI